MDGSCSRHYIQNENNDLVHFAFRKRAGSHRKYCFILSLLRYSTFPERSRYLSLSLSLERGFYRLPCVVFVALEIGSGRFNTSCVSLSAPERNKILRFGSSSPVSIGFLCRISICLSLFLSGASAGQIFLLFWSFRSDSYNISRENWDQQL